MRNRNTFTRTHFAFYAITLPVLLLLSPEFATAVSPTVQALGGAGRGGIPTEALYTNPAALALLKQSGSFFHYTKPNIPQWNAGGRAYAVGAYDGGAGAVNGGFVLTRVSRARIGAAGQQVYEDKTDYRFAVGAPLWAGLLAGAQARYTIRRDGGPEQKLFTGDLGLIYPVYKDLLAGFTYENVLNKQEEYPATAGLGAFYSLGSGIRVYGDGYRMMKGPRKGDRGWALGVELGLAGDFSLRTGRFQEALRRLKGWSIGLGWGGPRASFNYSLRMAGSGPKEKDHTAGMSIAF
jgi:hypothetical protein